MTARNSADDRVRMARLACWVGAGVLSIFVLVGPFLFKFLGITLSAFKIAGSIVLLLIALDMLRAKTSPVRSSVEETDEGSNKDDIVVQAMAGFRT